MPVVRNNTLHFNRQKSSGLDFTFIDGQIRQKLYVAGTDLNIFLYDGVHNQFKDLTNSSNLDQVFTSSPSSASHKQIKKAFDDNTETYYEGLTSPDNNGDEFIIIDMGEKDSQKSIINGVGLNGFGTGTLPQIIEFYGSDDAITWDILSVITTSNSDDIQRSVVVNEDPFRYYRFVAMDSTHNNDVWKLEMIELYSEAGIDGIQDHFFIENRDRKYLTTPQSLLCWYAIPDKPHDLGFFGFSIPSDQVELSVLISDEKAELGRSLMAGDIVSLPHIGDHANDDSNVQYGSVSDELNGKMYEVVDVQIPSDGYDRMWRDHLHTVVATPVKHRQETYDVTGIPNEGFIDLEAPHPLVTHDSDVALNNETNREARNAGEHGYDITGIVGDSSGVFTDDGIPNDGSPYTIGTDFPLTPVLDEWFLHEGFSIPKLYQWDGTKWIQREQGIRQNLGKGTSEKGRLRQFLDNDPESLKKK